GALGFRGNMSRVERWLLVGTAVLATGALASGLGRTDLWPPDEARVAEIAREMAANGNWVLPRLNGRPFIEEPPPFYWFQAGAWQSGRRGLLAAAVGAVGVAFGCKSFLPVALAVLTMLAFVVCAGWGRLRARELVLAVTVVTGFMAVWILAVAREVGAESVTFFVITNHLGRFM